MTISAATLFVLVGCGSEEEFESFTLEAIDLSWEDEINPTWYFVDQPDTQGKVLIMQHDLSEPGVIGSTQSEYELEHTSVTEDEITISFEDQTHRFERLSQTVAENEDKVRYQYRSTEAE
jgi:hypothetical protein